MKNTITNAVQGELANYIIRSIVKDAKSAQGEWALNDMQVALLKAVATFQSKGSVFA